MRNVASTSQYIGARRPLFVGSESWSDGQANPAWAAAAARVHGRAAALLFLVVLVAVDQAGKSVCEAQLRRGYYAGVCPDVETIVRGVVAKKVQQAPATVGATVRLFFHDCFVEVK
jgi:hypothetical protein